MKKNISPIIIIGMHRSGTTMITKMLKDLGLFVGDNLDSNCEPLFFIELNEWLLKQAGGSWDHPEVMNDYQGAGEDALFLSEDYARHLISTMPVSKFLGKANTLLKRETLMNIDRPWGWKDPRNTFTLPFWLKIFPDAKVIHIYRNGVDVAASLRARERKVLDMASSKHETRKNLKVYHLKRRNKGFLGSVRCLSLQSGFDLWEQYVSQGMLYGNDLKNEILNVKYERFIDNSADSLSEIARFCQLNTSEREIYRVVKSVNVSRSSAYTKDRELQLFYEKVKSCEKMVELGYE